jgi:SAM-dependent methyltransferase
MLDLVTEQNLRQTFDGDSTLYDRARPGYPAQVFDDLAELAGLGPTSTVIEIGPGTGQATRSLAASGAKITAVELGGRLADLLRRNLAGADVRVVHAAFEDWRPSERVDLVTSFTAWHWVDHAVRVQRVHDALRAGGHLATVTTEHVRGGTVDFFAQAQECYLRWDPATDPDEELLTPDRLPPITDEVDSSPLFSPGVRRRHTQSIRYTTAEYLDVLRTYSGHRALPPDRRQGLLDCLARLIDDRHGGAVIKTYLYELRVAQAHRP